ncbi:MAG: PEP-CTERM sorting domain-containing protein [Nitrosomonas oligotropha]|uniref:PEP-CTERM sorting domain-containing protein n=1 Tax=Nitrosomonas oligotropha TaxID=42354 RepID=A0A5C7VTY1_9PROT|nr:MAG: PEP-CTERM sorting domain-containing protein [Nitrosomonas oligotropha]
MYKQPFISIFAVSLVFSGLINQAAHADTKIWSSSDGFWHDDSSWSPSGVPGSGDNVIVSPYGGVDTILNFTNATGSRMANSLLISSETASTISFLQAGGSLTVSSQIVGSGFDSGSSGHGNYVLSGGSLSAEEEVIGDSYTLIPDVYGVFTQSGGTNTVTNLIISRAGSRGEYNLSGGSLLADSEVIGIGYDVYSFGTNGIFTQSGGMHVVNRELSIGERGFGAYTLLAGSLSANSESIGSAIAPWESGSGNFTQNGGTHTVSDILSIGYGPNGRGSYILNEGSLSTKSESIGSAIYSNPMEGATGIFTQSGGTHTVSDILSIGLGGFGTYTLNAGSLSTNSESIGSAFYRDPVVVGGTGIFTQSGGTHTVSGILSIGNGEASTGKYDLSAGSLSVGSEFIGGRPCCSASTGTFNQTGGVHTIAGLMTNNGVYNHSGGAFVVGAIDNSGTITQTGGTMTVNGNVINAASGKIEIANSPAIFTGDVVNNGQFKTTHTTVTFSGTYTENGSYISDPSINNFTNLIIGTSGYLVGGTGDEWHITGSFENHSLQNTLWNTANAGLFFDGGGLKSLYLAGIDEGASPFGFTNNFAFGSLFLAQGAELNILDGNATPGAAMYVQLLNLAGGVSQLSSIHSDYNIYYNPALAGNAYLLGKTYALDGGGLLVAAVPEPETYAMLLAGLSVLGFAIRRREQNRKRLNRFD